MSVVEFVDVVKSYGSGPTEVRALTDVSLSVASGEIMAVRGPSGCGKSRFCTSQEVSRIRALGGWRWVGATWRHSMLASGRNFGGGTSATSSNASTSSRG